MKAKSALINVGVRDLFMKWVNSHWENKDGRGANSTAGRCADTCWVAGGEIERLFGD